MTRDDRYVIDVADLQTIRLECGACQTAVTLPLSADVSPPFQCPGCGKQWMISQSPDAQALHRLIKSLRDLSAAASTMLLRVRFELTRDT